MLRVYLDQNKWIDLARAAHQRRGGEAYGDALEVSRYGVGYGFASFPLSSIHYMETLKRKDAVSRHRLAAVMAELSKFHAIAPPGKIVPAELDAALRHRFGKPTVPRPLRVFGVGVRHAFGMPAGRYRAPEHLDLTGEQRYALEQWGNEFLERGVLAGPPKGIAMPGMEENDYYRAFGERYIRGEKRLAKGLRDFRVSSKQLRDWLAASEVVDILDPLNETFERAAITKAESPSLETADGLTDLLLDLPSRAVVYELRRLRHQNPRTKWRAGDLEDLSALGTTIAYCDVVVTERQWCHLGRQSRLDERFQTKILSDLRELPAVLIGQV